MGIWEQFPFTFQSTLPARGATDSLADSSLQVAISIHAPRTGSDDIFHPQRVGNAFQSTLPARGATLEVLFAEFV